MPLHTGGHRGLDNQFAAVHLAGGLGIFPDAFGHGDFLSLGGVLTKDQDVYTFMMDQFHASRGFVLELMVVVILVIELAFVFTGKP